MTQKALTVSIVIPVYNEEHHLKACLEAIAAQTVKPLEVIVVDNNSTDGTVALARQFKFVRVVHEAQQGIVYARNRGFDAARGDLIGRIDADTLVPPNWVAQITDYYARGANGAHADTALAGACTFYNVRLPRLDTWVTSQFVFRMNRMIVGHYLLWGSNMALPRRLWQAVRQDVCLRNDIHEDLDLALHLHRAGFKIDFRSRFVVGARMRRVFEDHDQLWPYLCMWPQTLKQHHIGHWRLSYLGSIFLYSTQFAPRTLEVTGRWIGRPSLNEHR